MKLIALKLLIISIFTSYVFSQIAIFNAQRDVFQLVIATLIILSVALEIVLYPTLYRKIFGNWKTFLALSSIIVFNLFFFNEEQFFTLTFKTFFLLSLLVLLHTPDGVKILIASSDAIVVSVLLIATLAQLGVIPSTVSEMVFWSKNTAGFNNPNTPYYFVFSSFLIYYLFNSQLRLAGSILFLASLVLIDSFSRTYILGTIFIGLTALLIRHEFLYQKIRWVLLGLIISLSTAGLSLFIIAATQPDILSPLINSPLDILLSYRLSLAVEDIFIPANNIMGSVFGSKDSIYNELLFILGPIFSILYFFGVFRWWIYSKASKVALEFIVILSAISITGLMETMFFNITPFTVVLFSVAIIRPKYIINILHATPKITHSKKHRYKTIVNL
jgi:hypothetical protein